MAVTSNALFHYTKSLNNLKGIINNKFKLTYCSEKFDLNGQKIHRYIPMVSFCDIPLSQAKDHIRSYGSYGIGLSKQWGIANHLNPVTYIERNSHLANEIKGIGVVANEVNAALKQLKENNAKKESDDRLYNAIRKLVTLTKADQDREVLQSAIFELAESASKIATINLEAELQLANRIINSLSLLIATLHSYTKNYEGDLIRGKQTTRTYRFYDEREWRYVPIVGNAEIPSSLNALEYVQYRGIAKKKPLVKGVTIPFTCEDIKYLIVKSTKDISPLINAIRKTDGLFKRAHDAEILATKIFTVQQLQEDF